MIIDQDTYTLLLNALQWARQAGAVHLKYFRDRHLQVSAKLNEADVVTVADRESERLLVSLIRETYPDHAILTEESGDVSLVGDYKWIIDPLDGTTNFSSGLPMFAVSIAVEYKGKGLIGVVYAPYLDEMFHAMAGQGAYLNGRLISPSDKKGLQRSVVSTGFPVDKDVNADNNLDNVGRVLPLVRGLRRMGAAALDLCYVAAGFLDGYWELNLHEWDVAAGQVILSEAGARHVRFRPDRNVCLMAAAPGVYDDLISLIK